MHLTPKQATAMPPAPTLRAQQRAFDRFRAEYNQERPHEALGDRVPADLYTPSPRVLPEPPWGGPSTTRSASKSCASAAWAACGGTAGGCC